MILEELLPIRGMQIPDWEKHYRGLSMTGARDIHVPSANSLSKSIIEYVLNAQLNISNYTRYDSFSFHIVAYVDTGFTPTPEGVKVLDQIDELVLRLCVHIDAPRFAKVNKHQALRMIAQLLLDSVPKYLFDREDFDGKKFYKDILPIVQPIADGTRTFQDVEFPL